MRTAIIILAAVCGILVSGALIAVLFYAGAHNEANRLEKALEAAQDESEVVLANYGQKIREAAQVPGMQKDDLIEVFTASNESRYGKGGSKGIMTWIQEQNPNLDQSTYRQLQQMIEAGRNEFTQSQKMVIDRKRTYETKLDSFLTGQLMRFAGYPKIDLESIQIVSTSDASEAFDTGIQAAPISLRGSDG